MTHTHAFQCNTCMFVLGYTYIYVSVIMWASGGANSFSILQHALYLVYLGVVVLVSAWMGTYLDYNLDLISFFVIVILSMTLIFQLIFTIYYTLVSTIYSLGVAFWMQTGERQTARLRLKYLQSVLKKDINFFDNEARDANIIFHISSDAILVQDAIGDKVYNII